MARVQLYQTGNLANQAVGTPGVDPTGETIAEAGRTITEASRDYLKAETAKLKIANNIQAEVEKIKFENAIYEDIESRKQDVGNINNPYGLAESVYGSTEAGIQSYAKNISDPRVKQIFLEKTSVLPGQVQRSTQEWASRQTVTNAFVNVKEGIDAIGQQAAKMTDQNGFLGSLAQVDALITNAIPVIGVDKSYELRKYAKGQIAENFIYSKIDQSPETIKAYLNNGVFNGVLDEKEQSSVLRTAESIAKRNKRLQDDAIYAGVSVDGQQVAQKIYQGTASLTDVNNYIYGLKAKGVRPNSKEMQTALKMREDVIDRGGLEYASTDTYEALNIIEARMSAIEKKGKGDKASYRLKNSTLNELTEIQNELYVNGVYLSKATYDKYQQRINAAWAKHVSNNPYAKKPLKIFGMETPFKTREALDEYNNALKQGYEYLDQVYSGNKKMANMAKAEFSFQFNSTYDLYRNEAKARGVKWDVNNVYRSAISRAKILVGD